MPSIPQSLLWISLVVLWLFVLVPMLISKRDAVRRTSDVALATRVLNSGLKSRLVKRSGPSAGHRHDPDWQPEADEFDDIDEDDEVAPVRRRTRTRSVVMVAAAAETAEPDYLDVDIVDEDSGALPVGGGVVGDDKPTPHDSAGDSVGDPSAEAADSMDQVDAVGAAEVTDQFAVSADDEPQDGTADEYEYVDDTSGLEAEEDPPAVMTPGSGRSRRVESATAAAVSARKYRFRKRTLTVMAAMLVASAVLSFAVSPDFWWACGAIGAVTVLYLAYLRRQTRIEEQVRRRRQQRMARSRLGVENTEDSEYDVVPARLRQPGAAVLDIDDEDPIFEHLDEVPFARHYDLPRAAGQ